MLKNKVMHIILFQIVIVYFIQVASLMVQIFFIAPIVFYLIFIFKGLEINLIKFFKKNFRGRKNSFYLVEFMVFLILCLAIIRSTNGKLMSMAMYGWDFVGHFGVFRWGMDNVKMISSEKILSLENIESFLDSDYPQTYDLWGANYFRIFDLDNFGIVKAMLVFALGTLFFSYIIFINTYKEFLLDNSGNVTIGISSIKKKLYKVGFLFLIIQFLSFCWSTNCPHFALSTALIFRATVLSLNTYENQMNAELVILLLVSYILYPLTVICAGLLIINLFLRYTHSYQTKNRQFLRVDLLFFLFVILAMSSTVIFKQGRNIPLLEMLQSYGGVDFPSEFIFLLCALLFFYIVYFAPKMLDLFKIFVFFVPVFIIDFFLIYSQGFISYYGAKATIAFLTVAVGYLVLNLHLISRRILSLPLILAAIIMVPFLIAFESKTFQPTVRAAISRGFPVSMINFFVNKELQNEWANGDKVAILMERLLTKPEEFVLLTGGYPYLGNQWLIQAGRYPSEIWLGKIDFNGKSYNPIYFVSRDLNEEEEEAFESRYPYITLVRNK